MPLAQAELAIVAWLLVAFAALGRCIEGGQGEMALKVSFRNDELPSVLCVSRAKLTQLLKAKHAQHWSYGAS